MKYIRYSFQIPSSAANLLAIIKPLKVLTVEEKIEELDLQISELERSLSQLETQIAFYPDLGPDKLIARSDSETIILTTRNLSQEQAGQETFGEQSFDDLFGDEPKPDYQDLVQAQIRISRKVSDLKKQRENPRPEVLGVGDATHFEPDTKLYFKVLGSEKWIERSRKYIQGLLRQSLYGLVGAVYEKIIIPTPNPDLSLTERKRRASDEGEIKNIFCQARLYVPNAVALEVSACLDDVTASGQHLFEKEIELESLKVLNYLVKRNKELLQRYGPGWYPRFSDIQISKATGFSKESVTIALKDLTGVICETMYPRRWHLDDSYRNPYYQYFLPRCRYEVADQLLQRAGF